LARTGSQPSAFPPRGSTGPISTAFHMLIHNLNLLTTGTQTWGHSVSII
jgi:hypothetical protein